MPEATVEEDIVEKELSAEVTDSMLSYAISVITSRALPAVEDGLKPVQRRVLYDMHRNKITSDKSTVKSATVVGSTLGTLHPHGDSSVYDALVRLAQPWVMEAPLVFGQGNFGSPEGDPAAAYRYTECRLTPAAESLLEGLDEQTVDFSDNYDATLQEPDLLPASFPNLLVNGSDGIAVGLACKLAPHNLNEVVNALIHLISHPGATVDDLMKHIPGPDFPSGGLILPTHGIRDAYETGRGGMQLRARCHTEPVNAKRDALVITEVPYGVNPENLIESIADARRNELIDGILKISNDTSLRNGMRLVIEMKQGVDPEALQAKLAKHTPFQVSFHVNNTALIGTEPRVMSLLELCEHYLRHRREVVTRRTQFRLEKAESRAHIVEGLISAHDQIDQIVETIKQSENTKDANTNLQEKYGFSEVQANSILEMTLRRLTNLEAGQLKDELDTLRSKIAELKKLLESKDKLDTVIVKELRDTAKNLGRDRRTELLSNDPLPKATVTTSAAKDTPAPAAVEDIDRDFVLCNDGILYQPGASPENLPIRDRIHIAAGETVYAITKQGICHYVPSADFGEGGAAVSDYVPALDDGDQIVALLPNPKDAVLLVTHQGNIKRMEVTNFAKRTGSAIINLKDGDELLHAESLPETPGDVLLVSSTGRALRTPLQDVRPQGRTAAGVASIKLDDDATVLTAKHLPADDPNLTLVTLTDQHKVKATSVEIYPVKGRRGAGVKCQEFGKGETSLIDALITPGTPAAGTSRTTKELPLAAGRNTIAKKAPGGLAVQAIGATP